jgi:non-ribosomal peptide synthetase component F
MDSKPQSGEPSGHTRLIHELFEEEVLHCPQTIALVHADRHLTYAQLNAKANQLARYLSNQGIEPDEVVGICVERSIEMVIGLLAILKAGAAYTPLDPDISPTWLAQIVRRAKPRFVISQQELMALLPDSTADVIELHATLREIDGRVSENISATELGLSAQNRVYVIYTLEPGGFFKSVEMTHGPITSLIERHRQIAGSGPAERALQFSPLSLDVAFEEIFSTLCTGGTLELLDTWIRREIPALTEFLSSYRVERLLCRSLHLENLAELRKQARGYIPGPP